MKFSSKLVLWPSTVSPAGASVVLQTHTEPSRRCGPGSGDFSDLWASTWARRKEEEEED